MQTARILRGGFSSIAKQAATPLQAYAMPKVPAPAAPAASPASPAPLAAASTPGESKPTVPSGLSSLLGSFGLSGEAKPAPKVKMPPVVSAVLGGLKNAAPGIARDYIKASPMGAVADIAPPAATMAATLGKKALPSILRDKAGPMLDAMAKPFQAMSSLKDVNGFLNYVRHIGTPDKMRQPGFLESAANMWNALPWWGKGIFIGTGLMAGYGAARGLGDLVSGKPMGAAIPAAAVGAGLAGGAALGDGNDSLVGLLKGLQAKNTVQSMLPDMSWMGNIAAQAKANTNPNTPSSRVVDNNGVLTTGPS